MKSIELEDHEALVLFEFLQREITDRKEQRLVGVIEHPAEFWALNAVSCALERIVAEPFHAEYQALLDKARKDVMYQCDPEGTYPLGTRE
jgi:hypothetical protein